MPPTIIIGYDGSDHAQDALALGDRLATLTSGSVILAAVFLADALVRDDEFGRVIRADLIETLGRARDRMETRDVRVDVVEATSASHGLHELAERESANLVVVGSSHRGALGRILAGSVGERLLHGSPCAVAVAPVGYKPNSALGVVGVGYDGTLESREALDEAVALARQVGAKLRLVSVADPDAIAVPRGVAIGYGAVPLTDDLRRLLQQQLDDAVKALPDDLDAEGTLVQGNAAARLGSADVDLLICGSRGYGLAGQILLGGVSSKVVRGAQFPVLVVPRGGERPVFDSKRAVQEAAR